MELVTVRDLFKHTADYAGKTVSVGGWVRSVRASKTFGFIVLSDGTFFQPLQVVYHDTMDNFAAISKTNVGAALIVRGTLVETPDARQPFELQAEEVTVEGASTPDYPLQKKRHTLEYLRTMTHLRPRTNTFQTVFRVRSLAAYAIHQFFQERGFVYVHTPLITGSDCEGAGEMFQVTTLDLNHAAEFWMIEPEIAFADLSDDMRLAEDMIKYIISYVLENAPEEMSFFNQFVDKGLLERLHHVMTSDFGHVTYTEAIALLEPHNDQFEYPVHWGSDLQTEHERYLTEVVFQRPVFVTDYPKEIKAFYMKLNPDGKTVAAMDCLVPGIGEIIGGSQREDDLETLRNRMHELGLKEEDYGFYLDLRKYGSARHAGFGLGFERCVMYLTGMGNIRDVIPFPRTVNNCDL